MSAAELLLAGIDGTNPLGFLAALGTLHVATEAGEENARLAWRCETTWRPVLCDLRTNDEDSFSELVSSALRGSQAPPDAEKEYIEAKKEFEVANKAEKNARKKIAARRLSGKQREIAMRTELQPLQARSEECRRHFLQTRRRAVPSPELALGKHLDCKAWEYRERAMAFLEEAAPNARRVVDLMAAFGSDACRRAGQRSADDPIEPTPFCFISGSGHQHFLETAAELMAKVEVSLVQKTLFRSWLYDDESLAMRWDPLEDRRYALLDEKPADKTAKTMWMANLLAYRALALFPSAPGKGGLGTTGWTSAPTGDARRFLTWPVWESPLSVDTIRSLLQLREFCAEAPDRATLRARGVAAVFRAERIRVPPGRNGKLNFSPARAV